MIDYMSVYTRVSQGGDWLAKARGWMQRNVPRGDTLTWDSGTPVTIPFCKLEDLALQTAVAAILEDRKTNQGPGTPAHRFNRLLSELQQRVPHPNPTDSAKTYEDYFLEWLDQRIKADDANVPRGWVAWDGKGDHPTGNTKVHYRMRDGDVVDDHETAAMDLCWVHGLPDMKDWEIVAYKVVK